MGNKELISNEYYSLSELFSTPNRKIIIPDFQRDYCWGDKTHGEKSDTDIVSSFLDTLIEEFNYNKDAKNNNKDTDVLLGKIDVYEYPTNHIYLTDGQQRLTSLYLLLGMLYRYEQDAEQKEKIKRCLVSDFEKNHDDKEPYLQYAVRESTVFFLKDLVNEFFLKGNELQVADIKKQPWYFNEYDLDPSVISMLSALSIIEKKQRDICIERFSEFIINNIKIQYYDVEDKKHGEERFVIINTTGKSLTVSENIKPILLANSKNFELSKQWEERETYFWKNRNKEKENIADNGVNDFLTWCFQIIDKQDEIDIIKKAKQLLKNNENKDYLLKIHNYFNSLQQLLEYFKEQNFQDQIKFVNEDYEVKSIVDMRAMYQDVNQHIILPILSFIAKFKHNKDASYQFLRRIRKNYFDLKWEDRKHNYIDWRYILQIIEKSKTVEQVLMFETNESTINKIQNVQLNNWYNDEEKIKVKLKETHQKEIEEWEDHPDFMGDLSPLFKVVEGKKDFIELNDFYTVYQKINPNNFSFSGNIQLGNLYRLLDYLRNGLFEHRSVSGWGYCMLVKSEIKNFLRNNFFELWKKFKIKKEEDILIDLQSDLSRFFRERVLRNHNNTFSIQDLIQDTRLIGHYERVFLWAILEYLYANDILDFNNNICQFWEYPNLINIKEENNQSEINNYSIGNLILGSSYYNNKSGWIAFNQYPLMKKLDSQRDKIKINDLTSEYDKKLKEIIK